MTRVAARSPAGWLAGELVVGRQCQRGSSSAPVMAPRRRLRAVLSGLSPTPAATLELPPPTHRSLPTLGAAGVEAVVTTGYQREFHGFSGVDSDTFGDSVDPSFVSSLVSSATLREGNLFRRFLRQQQAQAAGGTEPPEPKKPKPKRDLRGVVHVSERMRVLRPLRLGEPFVMLPDGTSDVPHAKGRMSKTTYKIVPAATPAAKPCIVIERHGLAMDPSLSKKRDAPRPPPPPAPHQAGGGMIPVHRVQFTPAMVGSYCHGAVNAVHTDPVVAVEFGYAAPIWAGTQGMHICLEYVYRHHREATGRQPETIDVEAFFKRPVFWQEEVELFFAQREGAPVGVGEYALVKVDEGKAALELTVHALA